MMGRITLPLLALLALGASLAGCGNSGHAEEQVLEQATDARFDTDMAATEALRAQLTERFGAGADTATVEPALSKDGYQCQADPTAPVERACLKEAARGACTEMTITRVKPWRPQKAQVIVVCQTDPASAQDSGSKAPPATP